MLNTGDKAVQSNHGLLTTVAYQLGADASPQYALEGSIAIAGAGVNWLIQQMGMIKDVKELSTFAFCCVRFADDAYVR